MDWPQVDYKQHADWPQVDYNQHEELTHEEQHVDWSQVDRSQHQEQDLYTYPCEDGVLEQDHACVKDGYDYVYDHGYDHGYK